MDSAVAAKAPAPEVAPAWYKSAIIYELHVRAFQDGNGDGVGDFPGLIDRLDYLAELGVTAIWLLPFYPSPLKDDGYDISDYFSVHPVYGTIKDFRLFLREAHQRDIRVITELVINHTSVQHEWFRKSRSAPPGSYWRNFYVWSDSPDRYQEARIIFKDFEASNWSWDPVAKAYYWHRFYSHQPDLNFDSPDVQKAVLRVVDFWLEMGVDGMRLDAVPYLFERDGTSCENLPETHVFLKRLRKHMDEKYPGRMLLAEANQWPEDAVSYFGAGDECHMCFHFPLMPRLFMAIRMENRFSIIDILRQTPAIPSSCQWALFLRCHDELTLEMVTDEERDYMYGAYVTDPKAAINLGIRRRLAPLVDNDRRQIELLNALLFSLPGTPIIYYGDEIGMGDNIHLGDRNGVRTPFQWSPDRNAGFSHADPQSLFLPIVTTPEYHFASLNVETAQNNASSLLWWVKKLIALRKSRLELSLGEIAFVESGNSRTLAFLRSHGDKVLLIVANLARTAQCAELNLSGFKGRVPLELFGLGEFPAVGEHPYMLTLGPYGYYWFELQEPQSEGAVRREKTVLLRQYTDPLDALETREVWIQFAGGLLRYLRSTRWFLGKDERLVSCQLVDVIRPFPLGRKNAPRLFLVEVAYQEGRRETCLFPVGAAEGDEALRIAKDVPASVISPYHGSAGGGVFFEAAFDPELIRVLAETLLFRRSAKGKSGFLAGEVFQRNGIPATLPAPRAIGLAHSNASFVFEKLFHFKLYRMLYPGLSPEIEIGQFLASEGRTSGTARLIGTLKYVSGKKAYPIAALHELVENESDGWALFLHHFAKICEDVMASAQVEFQFHLPLGGFARLEPPERPPELEKASTAFALARQLGARVAALHVALGSPGENQDFALEPFSQFYQRSLYQSFRNGTARALGALRRALPALTEEQRAAAAAALAKEEELYRAFSYVKEKRIGAVRQRVHGDLHLAQVLFTGKDFVVIDFEGEPKRSFGARRIKRSCLADVAGMARSFDYLGEHFLREKLIRPEDKKRMAPFVASLSWWLAEEFCRAYVAAEGIGPFLPQDRKQLSTLLALYCLDKALYELTYELGARPALVEVALAGIARSLEGVPK